MIWIVTTESEKNSLIPDKKLAVIKKALGEENVRRIIAKDKDYLDVIAPSDTVLVETKDYDLIDAIGQTGARHTAESIQAIKCDEDKILLKSVLAGYGVLTPHTYSEQDLFADGKKYFVKPLILEDSIGIDAGSLCETRAAVLERVKQIRESFGKSSIIEEYIDGYDCTVAVIPHISHLLVLPIRINGNHECDYLTFDAKNADKETYSKIDNDRQIIKAAITTFSAIRAEHYARIDMRIAKDGTPYVIEVNLYPGLSNTGYMYRCFELNTSVTYKEMLELILATAKSTKATI